MLKFFQHTFLQQQIVIVAIALVLWLPSFLTGAPIVMGDVSSPLYNVLVNLFPNTPLVVKIIAFVVYAFTIFLFNSVLSANRLVYRASSIGALAFVLMTAFSPELTTAYPFLFACPFILLILHTLFYINQTDRPESYMMNVGYFLAIASMFYFPYIFLIVWVLASFIIMGYNELRYQLIPITAIVMAYLILFGLGYIFGNYTVLINSYSVFFKEFEFLFDLLLNDIPIIIILFLFFIVSFIKLTANSKSDKPVNVRKRTGIATFLTVMALILFFVGEYTICNSLIFVMFAFFATMAISEFKRLRLVNIFMTILLILAILNQYLPLLVYVL